MFSDDTDDCNDAIYSNEDGEIQGNYNPHYPGGLMKNSPFTRSTGNMPEDSDSSLTNRLRQPAENYFRNMFNVDANESSDESSSHESSHESTSSHNDGNNDFRS